MSAVSLPSFENLNLSNHTAASGLRHLSSKLGHNLPAVRQRTLQNILFKVKHGLSPDASEDMVFLQNLLLWFQHDDGDASNCVMLDLLNDLTHQQGVSAKLCSLGLPALLENLCISSGPEVKQKAHRTLTALLQSASTRLASAAGQQAQELSVHDPRSRCQSNSPAGLQHHPSGKTQLVPGSNRQYHSKPVKRMILTPQCSHAFGSQQGHSLPGTAGSAVEAAFHDERLARAIHRNSWRQGDAETNVGAVKELGWSLQRISVGAADEQYIFDLDVRLQYSDDSTVLLHALEELRLAAVADMPPEAILQRPSVLANVLALLQSADSNSPLPAAALRLLHALVCRVTWALGMAKNELYLPNLKGRAQPLQDITYEAEAMHSSYPPEQAQPQTSAAVNVTSITPFTEQDIDVTAAADSIAVHALRLLRNSLHFDSLMPLLQELQPLLLPPDGDPLQPPGLQRFKAYLQLVAEASEAQLSQSKLEAAQPHSNEPAELINLTASSAVVLQLAVQLCQQVPKDNLSEVLPAKLARLLGSLAADPLASACLPTAAEAVRPLLPHIHLPSFQLVQAATAAHSHRQHLQYVLPLAAQVASGEVSAAQWLHQASSALPGLRYLTVPILHQTVARLLDVICCTPTFCSPLSGSHDHAAEVVQSLLGSSTPHVRAAACKALAGAVCVGPPAARSNAAAVVCHRLVLRELVCTALVADDSQQYAAQTLQALAQLGNNEQRAALLAWNVWLACCAQDQAIGSTISGLNQYLHRWSTAQEPDSKWQQLQPAIMDLFRRDAAIRTQAACQLLEADLGLATLQHASSQAGKHVWQDPFAGLLDNGMGADLTKAAVTTAAQSFSQKDVQQLKSILCTPSFNPDIRRSAADQLLSLTACHRFQQLLTEPAVLYDLLDQLTGNMHILTGFNNVVGSARESASHGYASTDMQQLLIGDVQLPTACLQLLLALVQHCEETRELLLKDPDRLLVQLLPLLFSPYITVRRAMATLLTLLIFVPVSHQSTAATESARSQAVVQQSDSQPVVSLPALFLQHFSFPCSVASHTGSENACDDRDNRQDGEIMQVLQQRQLIESAQGTDSLSALMKSTAGSPWLPASLLQQCAAMVERTQAAHLVPEALLQVKSADSHAACLQALLHLQQLCCDHQMATKVAQADWTQALQHLLSQPPNTAEHQQLWLHLLPVVETLLTTHRVHLSTLQLLAVCLRQAALPVLASADAAQAAPSLPVALTHHADASFLFDGAQAQLVQIQLSQATLGLLHCLVEEVQLFGQAEACCDILQALDAAALMQLLCKCFISNLDAAYGTRVAALRLLTSLFACVRQTWSAEPSTMQKGSLWDTSVVACLASVVRHVCMPNHDTRLGGLKGKEILRQALQCLQQLVAAVPLCLWSAEWQQVGGTFWLTRLARDREAALRAAALSLLAHLAGPEAVQTRRMLLQGWPEAGSAVMKVALQETECHAVRAAALRFLAVAMVPSSQTAANEALPDQLLTLPHETSNTTLHPQSQDARFQPDLTDTGAAEWLSSAHKPRSGELPVRPFSSRAHLAGPLMLQSSFAAQYYTQGVWDFGIEQLLLQDSFWDQLLSLLQDAAVPAQVTWAATGVLLQAAIADPDFIQPRLADSKAWPALLAASRSRCSPIAQQHATLIARLGPSSIALQGLYTGRAQATHAGQASAAKQLSAQTDAGTASDASLRQQSQQSNSPGHEAEHSKAKALNTSNGNDPQRPHHAAGTDQGKAAGDWDVADLASAECEIAQAGTAGHVAQLIRLILQTTDCVADGNASSGHASKEALNAMLHCYVVHAQDAAGVLTAPVWCVQAHRQKAQQSMVQHAAEAAAALLARLPLSSQELGQISASLPASVAEAAAALHSTSSRLPLPAKLASCRLLANLMPSQDMTDSVLPTSAGAQGATMSQGLAATYLELSSRGAFEESTLSDRACAAAALRCVLAFNSAAKAEAVSQGLHMVLLDCVTSIHALLAVRAPEPQRHQQAVRKAGKKLHHAAWLHQGRANGKPQDGSSKQGRGSMAKGVKAGWHSAGDRSVQNCRPEAAQGSNSPQGLELVEVAQSDSETSIGMHSTSVVEPTAEATSMRQQLLTALSLLKHLAHNSPAACGALTDAGILHTARRLWKMALGHVGLLHEVLGLLANLFPGCPEAQRAFCSGGSPSMLQRCLDLMSKPNLDLSTLELVITVIANLACTSEGCLLLLRSSLLPKVEQELHQLLQRKEGPRVAAMLRPLIHLAAQAEGQKQILRSTSAPGLLDLLLTAAEQRHSTASCNALLVLRNLALATENKAHFVANPRALAVLLAGASRAGQNPQAGAYAAGALWGLVHQGEKVKASLRKLPNAEASLQAAEGVCFQAHQMNVQKVTSDKASQGSMTHVAEALKALQMLSLLLEFPKN